MVILQLEEQPPIIQAIFAGAVEEVKELIEYKQDINCQDSEKRTPLHAAAFKGDAQITSILLQNGARVNAKDSKWITPLHRACSVSSEETVSILLNYQADVSARDRLWQTPLHIAAANDAYNCVEQLLNYVPNPNVTDRSGRTAIHHAAYNGHTFVAQLLISRGCIVNACDKKDCRPLHCAVQMGHIDTVELLLRLGADINAKDRNQYTPLHVAAASGIETVCRLLLSMGAQVDARNVYGNTPLHIACLNGHLTVCQDLVTAGADLEATNFRGQTPLHIAAASTHGVDCLMFLLRQNVDINRQSNEGRTPLHMTAIHGRFTRSKTLIDKGAMIDCADKNGSTPLHIAAQYGHDILANTLLSFGANPSRKGHEGRTPLHMCCLSGYVECCRKFLQTGVNLNEKDDLGRTPSHCAAYKGSIECLDLLTSNGADFKMKDITGRLPLHYAAAQGHFQCVFTLVGIGSPVNDKDILGCTPLHWAAAYDLEAKCVEYLLNHKAEASVRDNRGYTPLHYAIASGNAGGVNCLLNSTEECIFKLDGSGNTPDATPLHLAAVKLGNAETLRNVLTKYNDVNIQTSLGYSPLILAAREGHAQCIHLLLRYGAKVTLHDNVNHMTAVHYSAKNGHAHCLSLLLHNSENEEVVNMLDRQHRTALMLAVSGNHIECVQDLLKCGADPNIVDTDDHSCLFRAVVNGQNSVVQLLLSSQAKVETTDVNGKSVLHLAAACGHFLCLQMILGYMTEEEVQKKDNQECTVLHWACYNGHANCVEHLLDKKIFKELEGNSYSPVHCATFSGSEKCLELLVNHFGAEIVHLKDCRQRTPLHIAALHGHSDCAKFLLKNGAHLDVIDEEGRTPFIAAAQYGQSSIVELLLTYNVEKSSCDNLGNTALHWACLKKHHQTALTILENCNDNSLVNITNCDKKSPLHLSARNGMVDVTRELLKKGSSVLAVDNQGLTPALCCAPNNNVAQCLALILQSLPEFLSTNTTRDDYPIFQTLLPFYERLMESREKSMKYCAAQTDISLTNDSDVLHRLKSRKTKKTTAVDKAPSSGRTLCNEIFVSQKFERDTEILKIKYFGKKLHKSCADVSIPSSSSKIKQKRIVRCADGMPNNSCKQCILTRKLCLDCKIKSIITEHMNGKTNATQLKDILSKVVYLATSKTSLALIRQKLIKNLEIVSRQIRGEEVKDRDASDDDFQSENILNYSDDTCNLGRIMETELKKAEVQRDVTDLGVDLRQLIVQVPKGISKNTQTDVTSSHNDGPSNLNIDLQSMCLARTSTEITSQKKGGCDVIFVHNTDSEKFKDYYGDYEGEEDSDSDDIESEEEKKADEARNEGPVMKESESARHNNAADLLPCSKMVLLNRINYCQINQEMPSKDNHVEIENTPLKLKDVAFEGDKIVEKEQTKQQEDMREIAINENDNIVEKDNSINNRIAISGNDGTAHAIKDMDSDRDSDALLQSTSSELQLALKLTMSNISSLNTDFKSEHSNYSSDNEYY